MTNRIKSFCWRLGMVLLAAGIDFVIANITDFNMPAQYTVLLGLVLGEVSKWLNTPVDK